MKPIDLMNIQRALISVHNKIGIIDFAKALAARNVIILSTGGTAALLQKEGIPVQQVSDYTGFPEMMQGRLKSLHPKIHGGLLGRRGLDDGAMKKHGILSIDLLVVNLYPFAETIKQPGCKLSQAIEQIDIGGPAMLRSAAKNFESVAAVVDPADYALILEEMEKNQGTITAATRFQLAQKVFSYTAAYESHIANYLNAIHLDETKDPFPTSYTVQFTKKQDLRYGENPHQKAALYTETQDTIEVGVPTAQQIQGKPLSYNNIADTNAALECVKLLGKKPACVIVKHANPCGAALADTPLEAYKKALACDPTSAFGGIIVFNKPLGAETVKAIFEKQFVEVLLAPSIEPSALPLLAQKPNVRVLSTGVWEETKPALDYTRVTGGLLLQERDTLLIVPDTLKVETARSPSVQEFSDLLFAWEVAKCVKSNAIVYAKDGATVGIGAGQMSRVFSTIIAGLKATDAGFKLKGAVMASDAFFPFRDAIDAAAKAGITAIIQPGGSVRDEEVIQAANEANIAMILTGIRHFKH